MWLTKSSIGRKTVMAITGLFLVLFVTFHVLMNAVAVISPDGYDAVCEFLGANWYALAATAVLAAGFVIHIILSFWISCQNMRARGNDSYAVGKRPKQVEWASQNMLVLGILVVCFMLVHLIQFWYKMQWQELIGSEYVANGVAIHPADGQFFLYWAFKDWWTLAVYLVGFAALWFHMSHGFWSAFQSLGVNNNIWMSRLRSTAMGWATVVCLLFAVEGVVFTLRANCPASYTPVIENATKVANGTANTPCGANCPGCPKCANTECQSVGCN
ncbi:MAG: succinate dehydrogenase cytochrome b subunit [Muribaculaceae bacterium]